MVCAGVVISGGTVRRSLLSPLTHVHSYSLVEDSILMHGVQIGRSAVVRQGDRRQGGRDRRGRRDRRRRGGRPRALPRVRGRDRRDPEGPAGARHEGRAADARVPAGGLRRGGRPRRVPGARAARVRGRRRALLGRAARRRDRAPAVDGAGRRRAASCRRCARSRSTSRWRRAPPTRTSRTRTRGTRSSAGTWPSCCTTSRTWRPSTRWSRCGRGRRSSSAAATGCRASARRPRWRTPTP